MTEVVPVEVSNDAVLDVVFLHGLDGDPRKSWTTAGKDGVLWPRWLAQDVSGVAVWSVGYEAWSSGWRGGAMAMPDRTINVLAALKVKHIGERPLIFVTHSMGGLIAKEALLHAAYGRTEFASFAEMTKGVVFLGTPHNGSRLTETVEALGKIYRGTAAIRDLRSNDAHLRHLSTRYRNWILESETGIEHLVFFETKPTKGVQVVEAGSADPGLPRAIPVAVDADHIQICKPSSRDHMVYGRIRNFVADIVGGTAATASDGTPDVPNPFRELARLRKEWSSRFPEQVDGGRRPRLDFDFHLHSALRNAVAAWLRQPGNRTAVAEALSGISTADELSDPLVVQATATSRGDSVRTALGDLWSVAQSAADLSLDGAGVAGLRFDIRCRHRSAAAARSVLDRWQPVQGGDAGALADFTSRLRLTAEPSPRSQVRELLASEPLLRVREPLAWIDRWTERLASSLSDRRDDPADIADELFSDLGALRLSPPKDRLSQGIVVLTDTFAPPARITPGDYLAGDQPKPSHVMNGFFAERRWQVDPAVDHLELWLDSVESSAFDHGRKLPVYWFEGRSGCGKSVLMLQTLARIRQTNRGLMLWLGNEVEELSEAVTFALANAEPGDRAIIVVDDGFSPAAQARSAEHWRSAVRALNTARNEGRPLPVIVTCGPTEQRSAFRLAFIDDVEVTARSADERLDSDHADELEEWFKARTGLTPPAHLSSSNVLMVQRFFQYGTGASLESFARRFKTRLEGMEESSRVPAFIAKLLAVNRLYVGLPAASRRALNDAERDVLTQLTRDDRHLTVSVDSGRGGVWLAHPHLADALFQGWFGERDSHKAAGALRDAIIECGLIGENSAERTAPLTALKLAVDRAHTAAFGRRLDLALLPEAVTEAYETLARSETGIGIEDLPAWIGLEQALPGVILTPTPRALGSSAIKDPSLAPETWLLTAHALLNALRPGDADGEDLLDALRQRICADDESSYSVGAVAARVAEFTRDPSDLDALARWLGDQRHWTNSGWALAYRALGSLTESDSVARIALSWLRSETTVANPGWGYVLDHMLMWVRNRGRERVLDFAVAWLLRSDSVANPAWCHVAQMLLRETRGEQFAEVEQACLAWLSDESARHTPSWHHLFRRMLNQMTSARQRRPQLVRLGRQYLQPPDALSPGWSIVYDALYSTLDAAEREELARAVMDWVLDEDHFSDGNWIYVCTGLMRHTSSREHARLTALAITWVREPMHQFLRRWDKHLEQLIRVAGSAERDDLVGIGTRWLCEWADHDDPRWGSVAQTLMRATDGGDQTELLALAKHWIDSESARENPLWPTVTTNVIERTPGAEQAPLFELVDRWLGASADRSCPGWTGLLELLLDAGYDRTILGALVQNRLVGRGRFEDVDDWGNLYYLVLGSDLVVDRDSLLKSGSAFLGTRSLDDRVDRARVLDGLLVALRGAERADLIRLEMLWLWNKNNWRLPSWNRVFQMMLDAVPEQIRELRQIGLQWLKNNPGNSGWGWVLERLHPLVRGQEREQLAAFLGTWLADPVNRDGPASSKAIECASAMVDAAALVASDVYEIGLDWLMMERNFAGRRWSHVFNALRERHTPEHAAELVDTALIWLSDSRSRGDIGWTFVLSAASDIATPQRLTEVKRLAESWLADPLNWGEPGWGYVAGRTAEIGAGLSNAGLEAAGRWLGLPLTRRNRTWRQCWKPVAPRLESDLRAAVIFARLEDSWMRSSAQWCYRYLDADGHVDLSAPSIGEYVVEWCSRKRWWKEPGWPHAIVLGLRVADPTAREALSRVAVSWLRDPGNTGGRIAVETALLDPIGFGDLAVSQTRSAVVSNIVDYGAFVNLGGPRGLVHKSQMGNGRDDPRKLLRLGQRVTVRVLSVDPKTEKIALSLRPESIVDSQLDALRGALPPLNLAACRVGDQLDGVVTRVVAYGLLVDVGGVSGLAHVSQLPSPSHLFTSFRVGQAVRCRVVSVDAAGKRLSLSLREPTRDEQNIEQRKETLPHISLDACREGDLLHGVVTGVARYGVFVDIGGVTGLLHNSEMEHSGLRSRAEVARTGHRLRVRVHRVDREKGRVEFSLRRSRLTGGDSAGSAYGEDDS